MICILVIPLKSRFTFAKINFFYFFLSKGLFDLNKPLGGEVRIKLTFYPTQDDEGFFPSFFSFFNETLVRMSREPL